MATTDLHMHILPYDYGGGLSSPAVGLARTAALIRRARREVGNTLLVDNGDFLHGNPMSDALTRSTLRGKHEVRGVHPIVAAMRSLGYDAMTLGNHDFDYGVEYLGQVLKDVPFPVVTSNLLISRSDGGAGPAPLPFTVPFTILERDLLDRDGRLQKLRVGLAGLLPPGSITGLRSGPFEAQTRDIVDMTQIVVPQLRAMGADLVLVLAHSGIGEAEARPGMENAVVPMAAVPGIDAIIAGHTHQVFPGTGELWPQEADPETGQVHGVPVVAPGFWGSHLGVIDLSLIRDAGGSWRVSGAHVETQPVAQRDPESGEMREEVQPDPAILRRLERQFRQIQDHISRPVGETRRRLHSYFPTIAPSPALDLVHRAMAWYGAREVEGTALAALPLLASTAPFKAGGLAGPGFFTDIPPGSLTLNAISDLYLYPNDLCALRLTGAGLADWLERAASVFNRIEPGRPGQRLLPDDVPAYGFEVVAGVEYEIDLTAPARFHLDGTLADSGPRRVRHLSIGGRPLGAEDEVLMMTNSYRISGHGLYPKQPPERIALDLSVCIRDVIADFLSETGPFDAAPWASWRFAPVAGASVEVRSAPEAQSVLGDLGDRAVHPAGQGPDGFMRFRLAL